MKLISFLCRTAALATVAFALGVAFDHYPVALQAILASAFVLLIVAADYAPRTRRWKLSPTAAPVAATSQSSQRLQLAA